MKTRMALVAVVAAALSAVVAPSPSFAVGDNNNATITGVASVPVEGSGGCRRGEFCMYTKPNYQGRIFKMPGCGTHAMQNWNGYGSWINNNIHYDAHLRNRSGQIVLTTSPGEGYANYNFVPIWSVTPC